MVCVCCLSFTKLIPVLEFSGHPSNFWSCHHRLMKGTRVVQTTTASPSLLMQALFAHLSGQVGLKREHWVFLGFFNSEVIFAEFSKFGYLVVHNKRSLPERKHIYRKKSFLFQHSSPVTKLGNAVLSLALPVLKPGKTHCISGFSQTETVVGMVLQDVQCCCSHMMCSCAQDMRCLLK